MLSLLLGQMDLMHFLLLAEAQLWTLRKQLICTHAIPRVISWILLILQLARGYQFERHCTLSSVVSVDIHVLLMAHGYNNIIILLS